MLQRLRPYLGTLVLAVLITYFSFHALTGDRGLLTSSQRDQTLAQRRSELKQIHAERMDLEARAKLLRDSSLSADLLEERARSLLGFADPKDYVIRTTTKP
ncbi:MAG TPA: septum formation initiator family protein [Caulobacteraceae bacterium]